MPTLSSKRSKTLATHSFTLILRGNPLTPELVDALAEAGCLDATFGERDGVPYATFDRVSNTFGEAVTSAIADIGRSGTGFEAVRVEPEELVNASAIAERLGRSRQSVQLLIEAKRGPGRFPEPAAWLGKRRLWRWADVSRWFATYTESIPDGAESALFTAALNAWLDLRRFGSVVQSAVERRLLSDLLKDDLRMLRSKALTSSKSSLSKPRPRRSTRSRAATSSAVTRRAAASKRTRGSSSRPASRADIAAESRVEAG